MLKLCVDLFPQEKTSLVRNHQMRVQVYRLLFDLTRYLITSLRVFYLDQQYSRFDPHVGETSCQIRAHENLLLAVNKQKKALLFRRLIQLLRIQGCIHEALKNLEKIIVHNNQQTIEEQIRSAGCLYEITKTEFFLVISFFLTEFKKYEANGEPFIHYDAISSKFKISRKLAKKLVRHFQISLAEYSCMDVFDWAEKLSFAENRIAILRSLKRYDDDNRPVLPCYFFTKIILLHLKKQRLPILFVIKSTNECLHKDLVLFFTGQLLVRISFNRNYTMHKENLHIPCLVVAGETNRSFYGSGSAYLEEVNRLGIEKVFMANMAAHPQYSGKLLSSYQANPFFLMDRCNQAAVLMRTELETMRNFAYEHGCCKEKKELLFVKHIYSDTIFNTVSRLDSTQRVESCPPDQVQLSDSLVFPHKGEQSNLEKHANRFIDGSF